VYLYDPSYTEEDKEALGRLSEMFKLAHLPPVKVVDVTDQEGEDSLVVDERTLVYSVDPDFLVRSLVVGKGKPAAMICRDRAERPVR
jgi:hypothetical protein